MVVPRLGGNASIRSRSTMVLVVIRNMEVSFMVILLVLVTVGVAVVLVGGLTTIGHTWSERGSVVRDVSIMVR